uniref:Uncharacterized protein n=1 Tax=Setaria italica TaxID=4555 RepID=K3XU82_SETIT
MISEQYSRNTKSVPPPPNYQGLEEQHKDISDQNPHIAKHAQIMPS